MTWMFAVEMHRKSLILVTFWKLWTFIFHFTIVFESRFVYFNSVLIKGFLGMRDHLIIRIVLFGCLLEIRLSVWQLQVYFLRWFLLMFSICKFKTGKCCHKHGSRDRMWLPINWSKSKTSIWYSLQILKFCWSCFSCCCKATGMVTSA